MASLWLKKQLLVLVSATAKEAQQEQEQVYKVKIQGKRTHNSQPAASITIMICCKTNLLDLLHIIRC